MIKEQQILKPPALQTYNTKRYRFFFHYHKVAKKMSVHFSKMCYLVDDISCMVPCETKHNKKQPYIVVQGWMTSFIIQQEAGRLKAYIR